MDFQYIKHFFFSFFEKNQKPNNVVSRKEYILEEIEKDQDIHINKGELSNKQFEITNLYSGYMQVFFQWKAVLPKESVPFPLNWDDPSRYWDHRMLRRVVHFIRPVFNTLWMEVGDDDWELYNPHLNLWIAGLADYSVCLLTHRDRVESEQVYYDSLDLFEQLVSFEDDVEVKLTEREIIIFIPVVERAIRKQFREDLTESGSYDHIFGNLNFLRLNNTPMIQSLSFSNVQQSANSGSWFSVTTPPDVVPFFIANDIQTSVIVFNVLESGLIVLTGFIFIFLLLRLHNLIFWFLDSFTEQDLSEFRQIIQISPSLFLTCIRYLFMSIELILIIIIVYKLWVYVPIFFIPPSLFFPNFQTPKNSLIRGFDSYNFNRMPLGHEDYDSFDRFRPISMYFTPLANFWRRYDENQYQVTSLRSIRYWVHATEDTPVDAALWSTQIPVSVGPAQYLFLQQIAGFDWFREKMDQNFHLKFISRFKIENETRFLRYPSDDDILRRQYYLREQNGTQFEQCLRLLFPRYSVVLEAKDREEFLQLDIDYQDRTLGAYFLTLTPQGEPQAW